MRDGELAELVILATQLVVYAEAAASSCQTVADAGLHCLQMNGKETYKHAVRRMEMASKQCLDRAGLVESEISWIVPHQANVRIIEGIAKRFGVPMERIYLTIHKYGNTSASSIGIALDELLHEKGMKQGENLLLVAFGAGLTWGASVLTWDKEEYHE